MPEDTWVRTGTVRRRFYLDRERGVCILPSFTVLPLTDNESTWDLVEQKWRFIEEELGNGVEITDSGGRNTCAFCQLYWEAGCRSCPISQYTGKSFCIDTPHCEWCEVCDNPRYDVSDLLDIVQREREFLRKVRFSQEGGEG